MTHELYISHLLLPWLCTLCNSPHVNIGYVVAGHKLTCATRRDHKSEGLISLILDPGHRSLDARVHLVMVGSYWNFVNFSLIS